MFSIFVYVLRFPFLFVTWVFSPSRTAARRTQRSAGYRRSDGCSLLAVCLLSLHFGARVVLVVCSGSLRRFASRPVLWVVLLCALSQVEGG